jgi:cell division septation protein DedD
MFPPRKKPRFARRKHGRKQIIVEALAGRTEGKIMRPIHAVPVLVALLATSACKTDSAAEGVRSAGESVASGVGGVATSLVNVNLSNVLNNLALDLKIDKANIPINAQIPITVAANVCGVSINILSIGAGGGSSQGCTAKTTSPELAQAVQQQLAANGSVGGGAQTTTPATTTSTTTTPTTTTPTTATPTTTTPPATQTTDPGTTPPK